MKSLLVVLRLSWEQFVEHYRAADSRLLRWTQSCLLFLLLLLSMTSFNIQHYLEQNMQQLLGADVVVVNYTPVGIGKFEYLSVISEKLSVNQLTDITLTFNDKYQQAQLKVVDDNYPVQGYLQVSRELAGKLSDVTAGPKVGELWVDSRLLVALQLSIGDDIELAGEHLKVTHIIEHEPDRLMEGHSVQMRAMVHQDSLDSEYLKAMKSSYRYLMNSQTPKALLDWVGENIAGAEVLHRDGGHPLAMFWLRVENFIGLSSVLLFLMAAIAIDLTCRRHLVGQKRFVAVIMSMGAPKSMAIAIGLVQWMVAFLTLLPLILLLVYGALNFAIEHMSEQFVGLTMVWSWPEVWQSTLLIFLLLLSFQVPSAIELTKVSVADLFRAMPNISNVSTRFIWSFISIGGFTAIYADNWLLTAMTLGVMLMTIVILMGLTWLVLTISEKLTTGQVGMLPFALFMMKQRLLSKSTQILGVGLCALLLLSTLGLMRDFGQTLEQYRRIHDGNLLLSRANEQQVAAIKQWADENNTIIKHLKPYTVAQLVQINEASLDKFTDRPSDSMARLQKPINLHYTDKLPSNNRLTAGNWWKSATANYGQVSVEEEIMTDLGLSLGDKLTFLVEGKSTTFEIVAAHVYQSGNGSITFWFQVPLSFKQTYQPSTYYLGSLELPDEAWKNLGQLWRRYATIEMISIAQMTARFDRTLGMVTSVISAIFLMICVLAILVILASVKGYELEERRKNGLLLSFGQSKMACLRLALYEWLITGLIAATGAVIGAVMMGNMVFESQFDLPYYPDWSWLVSTIVIVMSVMTVIGLIGSRTSLQSSPRTLLQS